MFMYPYAYVLVLSQAGLPFVNAVPMETDPVLVDGDGHAAVYGQYPAYRTITVFMCILYAFLLASAHGEFVMEMHT
jgi:hypothetical protein